MVLPGIGSHSPLDQSFTLPDGCDISPGESCCIGAANTSFTGSIANCPAIFDTVFASERNISQSDLASHGGEIAGLNGCTNGCKSVLDKSNFSYHVAAGKIISE